jgi:hypothetical protein
LSLQNLKDKADNYVWSVLCEVHEKLEAYLYPRTRNKTFYYPYEPTRRKLKERFLKGDIWFDTNNRYAVHTWDGNRWLKVNQSAPGA